LKAEGRTQISEAGDERKLARRWRDRQLIIELAIIGLVFLLIVSGGASLSRNVPWQWSLGSDSASVTSTQDLRPLALYYNLTLSEIATGHFTNASFLIETFSFVNVAQNLLPQSDEANTELALINVSIPLATNYFALTQQEIAEKNYSNASALINYACMEAQYAEANYTQFANSTTPRLSKLSVPTGMYSIGMDLVDAKIHSLSSECQKLKPMIETLYPASESSNNNTTGGILTISSSQKSIETGGTVKITGRLLLSSNDTSGVSDQSVSFYFNGSYIGSSQTAAAGFLNVTLTIPFVYSSTGDIWASAQSNSSISFAGAISNHLYFSILFNSTKIIVKDPPPYLPTFNFTVQGSLNTSSGVPLPSAPVRITFMNETVLTSTNEAGIFTSILQVPADAGDGTYYVYAAFAPHGVYGPSFNFTTIQVAHEPMNVTVNRPWISLPGFSSSVFGSAEANGTLLSNVSITLQTPWAEYHTRTDNAGRYKINVEIPLLEFAFNRDVSISALPPEPYLSNDVVTEKLALFNILWAAIPSVVIGAVAYELNLLGLLPSINLGQNRGPRRDAGASKDAVDARKSNALTSQMSGERQGISMSLQSTSAMTVIFNEVLLLARRKFDIEFRESMTIREIIAQVSSRLSKMKNGEEYSVRMFSDLCFTMEDYLFSKSFEEKRAERAARMLADLRTLWGN